MRPFIFCVLPVAVLLFLSGCSDCEDNAERKFGLVFFRNSIKLDTAFHKVYGLGGSGDIYINANDSLYRLPISLLSDSSTYILERSGEQDTLTIKYKREFFFENKSCGNRVRFSDLGPGKSSSYANVRVIDKESEQSGIFSSIEKDVYEIQISL